MHSVLIVDDEPFGRETLAALLQAQGYQLLFACDGHEALMEAATRPPDLILLDVMMPGEDGLSLCRSIRETSQIPVILLTARGEEVDRIIGLEMGADDYIPKPFSPRELVAREKSSLGVDMATEGHSVELGAEKQEFPSDSPGRL